MLEQHWMDRFLKRNPAMAYMTIYKAMSQARAIWLNASVVDRSFNVCEQFSAVKKYC